MSQKTFVRTFVAFALLAITSCDHNGKMVHQIPPFNIKTEVGTANVVTITYDNSNRTTKGTCTQTVGTSTTDTPYVPLSVSNHDTIQWAAKIDDGTTKKSADVEIEFQALPSPGLVSLGTPFVDPNTGFPITFVTDNLPNPLTPTAGAINNGGGTSGGDYRYASVQVIDPSSKTHYPCSNMTVKKIGYGVHVQQ
jgi:hypothetical protein